MFDLSEDILYLGIVISLLAISDTKFIVTLEKLPLLSLLFFKKLLTKQQIINRNYAQNLRSKGIQKIMQLGLAFYHKEVAVAFEKKF